MIIVLPSKFTGGAVSLTRDGSSVAYDWSEAIGMQTTVMSWFTGTTHAYKPITSGHKLALVYDLLHTPFLRPLSFNKDLKRELRRLLRYWQQDRNDTSPSKIVYLLDNRCPTDHVPRISELGSKMRKKLLSWTILPNN